MRNHMELPSLTFRHSRKGTRCLCSSLPTASSRQKILQTMSRMHVVRIPRSRRRLRRLTMKTMICSGHYKPASRNKMASSLAILPASLLRRRQAVMSRWVQERCS